MLTSLGKAIGLGFGAGLSPVAPGTVGSLAAVALYYIIHVTLTSFPAADSHLIDEVALALLILVGLPLGIWATGLLVTDEEPDPGRAVWDEYAGMWITCLFLPPTLLWLGTAFICFRVFDILKPWPANWLERLPGGWGIMADDVVAGLYGMALLNASNLVWRLWFAGGMPA